MDSHHDSLPWKWNTRFLSRTLSLLPLLAVLTTWVRNVRVGARRRRRWSSLVNWNMLHTFFYMKTCVCSYVSAYHPSLHLHCQPLWGRTICMVAVQLQNHNKISHECILEARRYITDVHSAQVTHGISGLNMWTIYQVHHLSFLSFSPWLYWFFSSIVLFLTFTHAHVCYFAHI